MKVKSIAPMVRMPRCYSRVNTDNMHALLQVSNTCRHHVLVGRLASVAALALT